MSSLKITSRSTTLGGAIEPPDYSDQATVDQSWVEQRAQETRDRISARAGKYSTSSIQALADKAQRVRQQLEEIETRAQAAARLQASR
jgi:hypothetical protein